MAWPADGNMPFCFLATSAGKVTEDALLGSQETPDWQQTNDGLTRLGGFGFGQVGFAGVFGVKAPEVSTTEPGRRR